MSAIAGIIHLKKEPVPFEHGRNIMKGLEKFPADDIQFWHKHNAFIGNHAQWITPESVGEQQPFYDSERQCVITADAIIDNREELFEKLQVERSRQKHMPDSQLILLAYYKWGEESPKHLVGDFAYIIWDERNQKLFGARDFSGSRTLYYYKDDERFAFCTTIMPLFTLPGVKKELNEEWMAEFLAIPGMVDAIDVYSTVYKTILQVPPSHAISISYDRLSLKRYNYIKMDEKLVLKTDFEYEEAFREVFNEAVTSRIRSIGEVGAHLSGGLDSGSVVSFAAKALKEKNKRLHTYSYIPVDDFEDWTPNYALPDERPYIKSTVKHVGNIKDNYLDFKGSHPFSEVDDWLDIMEMPYKFFENSFWVKGIYEQASHQGIKVLLSGARGNATISWGPVLDYYATLFRKLKWMKLFQEVNQYCRISQVEKSRLLKVVGKKAFPALASNNELYSFPKWISPELAERVKVINKLENADIYFSNRPINAYEERERHFAKLFYWNATGISSTKASLNYASWNRDPTNDLRVVKFTLSVPDHQFIKKGQNRSLVRRSTVNLLPNSVRLNQNIRGKQGADWLHRMVPQWGNFICELDNFNNSDTASELINKKVIKTFIDKYRSNPLPQNAFNPEIRVLMRSFIVYKFIRKNIEGR
ncbi:asparagine synthase-related protein [Mesobacillus subterraneus]|uniref:asparagine synthase-related protein n=1 Tax=Mesobacillus subterraneus TaxID=285983 RepID=UPI00203B8265|nr:asparagine synthase-related protein [Mesobacillus subterraneus]MCM3574675.1 asparagine synthase-related protein [Mesobacillus subterraneus]